MSAFDSGDKSSGPGAQWTPSAREQKVYGYLFSLVDTDRKGVIQGQAAVPFFQKSGLADTELGRIWQLADKKSKGHLTQPEFGVAMKLISLAQANRPALLSNLGSETKLPELRGVDLPLAIEAEDSRAHTRRGSSTSSVGWPSFAAGAAEATVPANEREQYKRLFENSHPVDGAIDGMAARAFLMKSKLSTEQLGRIWNLADPHAEGRLHLPGFVVAMYYVRRIMENRNLELPSTCPPSLWKSAGGDIPAPSLLQTAVGNFSDIYGQNASTPDLSSVQWDISAEEKERYDQFFNNLDKSRRGYLSGDTPVNFFLKSRLSESVLAKVWDLADTSRTGKLNKEQFAVAMHLINARLAGREIPDTLPATLVPPSMRKASIASSSLRSLSPSLRPVSARDRTHQLEPLRRAGTLAYTHGSAPSSAIRPSTSRSPPPKSPTSDDSEIAALQGQLNQLEDMSRGLQTQRTTVAGQIAVSSARKQELEVKISALQSSQEAEAKINYELEEKLKTEQAKVTALQAQVDEAGKKLAIVGAQKSQLERDVQHVQSQQNELQQRLRQAQEEGQRLTAEISALDRQKKHLEQVLSVAQSQIAQQEDSNKALGNRIEGAQKEVNELSHKVASLPTPSASGAVTSSQARSVSETQEPSFDEIFGSGDESANLQGSSVFGEMFKSPSPPGAEDSQSPLHHEPAAAAAAAGTNDSDSFAQFTSAIAASAAPAPAPAVSAIAPSAVFASIPSINSAAASSAALSSSEAFDSFGAHSVDPFEEFLQSTVTASPIPASRALSNPSFASSGAPIPAERPADTLPKTGELSGKQEAESAAAAAAAPGDDFDAIFGNADASKGPSADAFATVAATRALSDPGSSANAPIPLDSVFNTASDAQISLAAEDSGSKKGPSSSAAKAFDADFNTAFGMMPGSGDKAITQEIETFESKFPDISSLNIPTAATGSKSEATDSSAKTPLAGKELTFDDLFGPSNDTADPSAAIRSAPPAKNAGSSTADAKNTSIAPNSAAPAANTKKSKDSADDFVPPPVVKRTNVSARPISRVLSIFRPSSNNRSSVAGAVPPLPKRSATDNSRQRGANKEKDKDKEFEAKWAKGDWPDWVKKGEYLYERRTLVEMGYSKDRVVEALEVNDFNLTQATEYLLSS